MNAIAKVEPAANPLIPTSLDEAARLAKIMSDMSLVPSHLQGKPADCMLVIEAAFRWRMSPFAVAQATSVLQGKLNYEGKLVAAALQTSGVLSSRLRYDYEGENGNRAVVVSAVVQGETAPREVLVKLADVKTSNKMWTQQTDQQLAYAGARIWARRHAPEVMLGVYAPEEFEPEPERPDPKPVKSTVVPRSKLDPVAAEQNGRINRMSTKELDDATNGDVIPALATDAADRLDRPDPPWVEDRKPADKVQAGVDALLERIRGIASEDELHALVGEPQTEKQRSWLTKHRPELEEAIASALGDRYAALVAQTVEEPA
jgi:hypothetical protein